MIVAMDTIVIEVLNQFNATYTAIVNQEYAFLEIIAPQSVAFANPLGRLRIIAGPWCEGAGKLSPD